jgi:hypothetical protein
MNRGGRMVWTWIALSRLAFPCAALTTSPGEFAMSDAQEAILSQTDEGSEVSYRVSYSGDATHFGWLIVVPGVVTEVREDDPARFDNLRALTDPEIELWSATGTDDGSGCGCGGASKGGESDETADFAGGADSLERNEVEIAAEGFTGPYEYTVLRADETGALVDWLDDNGFELGGTETTLGLYVDEGDYSFVAVSLSPSISDTPEGGRVLPPLTVATDSSELRFPARMALTGEPEWVRTVVWVEGTSRATITGAWTEQIADALNADDQDPSVYYSEYLQSLAGAAPVYLQVFSDELDGVWVTRFDTFAAREVHTADPVFELTGDEDQNGLVISGEDTGGAWLFLPLLGLGWGLRRRGSTEQRP